MYRESALSQLNSLPLCSCTLTDTLTSSLTGKRSIPMTELVQISDLIKAGQPLPALVLGYGEESYYINRLEELVVEKYIPKEERTTQLVVFFGSETTAPEVLQQAQTVSMFAPKRLIVLRDAQDLKKSTVFKKAYGIAELIRDATTFAEGTTLLVLHHGALPATAKKNAQALKSQVALIESIPIKRDNELREAMLQMAATLELQLAPQATTALIERVGYDLETLHTELQKLSIPAKSAGGLISKAMVVKVVSQSRKHGPYDLLNAVQRRRGDEALQIALDMAQDEKRYPVPQIVASLYGFFANLIVVHYLPTHSQKDIQAALDLKYESQARMYQSATRLYSKQQTLGIISAIRKADGDAKGAHGVNASARAIYLDLLTQIFTFKY